MISSTYLAKIRRGVRINQDDDFDAELTDIIEECRADLMALGVLESKASSETDSLILGAVRAFARWKFPLNDVSAERSRGDYMIMRDELRRRTGYIEDVEA